MTTTLLAQAVNLRDLIDSFDIELVEDEQFFLEWQVDLPKINNLECFVSSLAYSQKFKWKQD